MNGRWVKFLAAVAFGSATMFGNTVTLEVVSGSSGNTPYLGALNPTIVSGKPTGGTPVSIYCDDQGDTVYAGEYWTANVTQLSAVETTGFKVLGSNLQFQTVSTSVYEEAAWLVWQVTASNNAAIQTAIWDLFQGLTDAAGWDTKAKTSYTSLTTTQINETEILSPIVPSNAKNCGTGVTCGTPQEFFMINATPEPATFAMFGGGLILLSLGTFRRRRAAKSK